MKKQMVTLFCPNTSRSLNPSLQVYCTRVSSLKLNGFHLQDASNRSRRRCGVVLKVRSKLHRLSSACSVGASSLRWTLRRLWRCSWKMRTSCRALPLSWLLLHGSNPREASLVLPRQASPVLLKMTSDEPHRNPRQRWELLLRCVREPAAAPADTRQDHRLPVPQHVELAAHTCCHTGEKPFSCKGLQPQEHHGDPHEDALQREAPHLPRLWLCWLHAQHAAQRPHEVPQGGAAILLQVLQWCLHAATTQRLERSHHDKLDHVAPRTLGPASESGFSETRLLTLRWGNLWVSVRRANLNSNPNSSLARFLQKSVFLYKSSEIWGFWLTYLLPY